MTNEEIIDVPNGDGEEIVSETTDLRSVIEAARDKQRETQAADDVSSAEPAEADEPVKERKDGRDEKGRFAAKEKAAEVKPDIANEATAEIAPETDKPVYRAPPGWSVSAKAAFNELPEAVKESIAKREAEVDQGFKRYGGLKQYAEYAESNGTTLAAAVQDYAKIENGLRTNYLSGIDEINKRFNVDPAMFIQAYAQRYGVSLGQSEPDARSQSYQPSAVNPDVIEQRAAQRAMAEIEEKMMRRESLSEIERFSSDPSNQFFENVREDMAILLQNGKANNLQDAYDKAVWSNPETRAIMLKSQQNHSQSSPQAAVQKAKAAAKATGGAPSPGFNPSAKPAQPNMSIHDNIRAAIAAQRG